MEDIDLMYLDTIEERLDEDNIVTYRWLSLAINVSSNSAKQMLYNYYTKFKSSKEQNILCASYLLSGICFDNELKQNIDKICVVQEDELEEIKKEFNSLNSVHMFSLQKKQLKDIHVLYAADKDIIKDNYEKSKKLSAISAPSSFQGGTGIKTPKKEKKSDTNLPKELLSNGFDKNSHKPPPKSEIPNISSIKDEKKNQLNFIKKEKQNIFTKKSPEKKKNSPPQPTKTSTSAKGKASTTAAKGKTSTIASMFAKQAVSAPPTKEKSSTTKQNGFHESKTNNKEIDKENKSEVKCEQKETVVKVTKRRSASPILHKNKPLPKKAKLSPKKTKLAFKKRGKKRTSERSEVEPKRMRILAPDSSSEEDEKEEEIIIDEECPLPTSYQACTETIQNDSTTRCGRWVDKTYEDDDGYFVTKKEFEIVEKVEDKESPLPSSPKKSEKLSPSKKSEKLSPQKKLEKSAPVKQASIMNFFKRK